MGLYWWKYDTWGSGDFVRTVFHTGIPLGPDSGVVASITELDSAGLPQAGQATLEVHNVVPKADGWVEVVAAIRWGSPLHYRITLMVIT